MVVSWFVFFAMAGLAWHQIASWVRPRRWMRRFGRRRRRAVLLSPRGFVLLLPDGDLIRLRFWLWLSFTAFVLSAAALAAAGHLHPSSGYAFRFTDFLTSRVFVSGVFGTLTGVLVGDLTNRIIRGERDYVMTRRDHYVMFLILLFMILGTGGEEVLRSYAERISKVSLGATSEIAFDNSARARPVPEAPGNADLSPAARAGTSAPSGSRGLENIANLNKTVHRDIGNFGNLSRHDDKIPREALHKDLELAAWLATNTVVPLATCLAVVAERTLYKAGFEQELHGLERPLRALVSPGPNQATARRAVSESLARLARRTLRHARELGLSEAFLTVRTRPISVGSSQDGGPPDADEAFVSSCAGLAALVCGRAGSDVADVTKAASSWDGERASIGSCVARGSELEWPEGRDDRLTQRFAEVLEGVDLQEMAEHRPYVAMAYAYLMAQLGEHQAGVLALHEWIARRDKTNGNGREWFVVRARAALAVVLEEWIRRKGDQAEPALRHYHVANFRAMQTRYESSSFTNLLLGATGSGDVDAMIDHPGLVDDGLCALDPPYNVETAQRMFESYLSTLYNAAHHTLEHPLLASAEATTVDETARKLLRIGLRCAGDADRAAMRAEHLELFARNLLNLSRELKPFRSKDELERLLKQADRATRRAQALVQHAYTQDLVTARGANTPLPRRLHSTPVMELYARIANVRRRIEDALLRLSS